MKPTEFFDSSKMTPAIKLNNYRNEPSFVKYLADGNFRMIMYSFGHDTLCALLKDFEVSEDFETCLKIKEAIQSHNDSYGDILPTRQIQP